MSIIPDFDIGIWNAWILIIPLIIFWFGGVKFLFSKRMSEEQFTQKGRDKIVSMFLVLAMFFSFFYSIFLSLKLGTVWFYIGLIVYLIGLILIILTMINFATTQRNKPVTKGLYRYSRNPMFIGFFIVYAGIAIACISWVYTLLTILFILIVNYLSPIEEAVTLKHYGKNYKEYIDRTPKWIGLPKSEKKK